MTGVIKPFKCVFWQVKKVYTSKSCTPLKKKNKEVIKDMNISGDIKSSWLLRHQNNSIMYLRLTADI